MSKPKSKTDELREKFIEAIDLLFKKANYAYSQYEMDVCVAQLLKACKAMGMEFVDREAPTPDNEAWHKDARLYEAFCAGINIVVQNGWNKTEEMEKTELYNKKIEELQKVWEDNKALLHERHDTFAGIRSSQVAALLLYLIEIGVIKDD